MKQRLFDVYSVMIGIEQSRAASTMNFNKQENNVVYIWEFQIITTMILYLIPNAININIRDENKYNYNYTR